LPLNVKIIVPVHTEPIHLETTSLQNENHESHNSNNTNSSMEPSESSISSVDSYEDPPLQSNESLEVSIASWAIRHSITHSALNNLLITLSNFPQLKHLPKNARTLLKTPTTTIVKEIKGGIYHHFGINQEIEHMMKLKYKLPCTLELMVGIDGLPISKNPPSQLWPVLGYFSNLTMNNIKVFIIGCYYGKPKPEDSNEFLEDFVNEINNIVNNDVVVNNILVKVILKAIICDVPAKSYILNVKGHTGKKSCVRCQITGEYENNRVYFPTLNSPLRTHDDFIAYSDKEFHSGHTLLTNIPKFDLVNNIPFDYIYYMHWVCIGIMKKLLVFWNGGIKRHKLTLPHNLISVLDDRLNHLGQYIPEEFQRASNINSRKHLFRDASRWKATKLRQLILYTGIVVLLDIVDK